MYTQFMLRARYNTFDTVACKFLSDLLVHKLKLLSRVIRPQRRPSRINQSILEHILYVPNQVTKAEPSRLIPRKLFITAMNINFKPTHFSLGPYSVTNRFFLYYLLNIIVSDGTFRNSVTITLRF